MKLYTSNEASAATGATLRQLQWWDETGRIVAGRGKAGGKGTRGGRGNARLYSNEQVRQIQRIMEIRRDFQLQWRDIPAHGKVRVITGPTEINGVLVIPKVRAKQYA